MSHDRDLLAGTRAHYEDARLYDQTYRRRRADVRYYVALAQRLAPPGPVLEVGFGTGRVGLAIARAGIDVVGVDPSAAMLARARERWRASAGRGHGTVTLRRADVRTMALGRRFALIVSPFNVLQHLYTAGDIGRALDHIRAHLLPRGRFAFDVLHPDVEVLSRNRRYRVGHVSYEGRRYRYDESYDYDARRQVQMIYLHFVDEAQPPRGFTVPLAHRQFFAQELLGLLDRYGFDVVERWGDFDRTAFVAASEQQVLLCARRA